MNKTLIVILMLVAIGGLIGFIYPKFVGGPLCGPVCSSLGLHYYVQDCLGIRIRDSSMTDSYNDACYGLAVGRKRCYGRAYSEYLAPVEDHLMDCNYPCGDEAIRISCAESAEKNLTFEGLTIYCSSLIKKCRWEYMEVKSP